MKSYLTCVAAILVYASLLSACDRGDSEAPAETAPTGVEPEATEVDCEFVRATRSLVTLNLETANGDCTLILPSEPRPGTLTARVAVAGRDDSAAVQLRAEGDAFYYATEGTVTIEQVSDSEIRGHFVVSDNNPPETGGPFRGTFAVSF